MAYQKSNGLHVGVRDVNLGALIGATITASGKSAVLETVPGVVVLKLAATAVGVSATVAITIETSYDGVTYYSAGTFTTVTTTGSTQAQVKGFVVSRFTRADYVLGGSGTAAIALTGDASA